MVYISPELLEKYAAGDCTEEENLKVEAWLSSPQNLTTDLNPEHPNAESNVLEEQIWAGIQSARRVEATPKKGFDARYILSIAACIALAISAIFYLTRRSATTFDSQEMMVRDAPKGSLDTLLLSDGSRIILNAGATLQFPKKFKGAQREVSLLAGEAFFEIHKDATHPFIVHTDQTIVRVLGTKFNINKVDQNVSVILKEGKVAFSQGKDSVTLSPGERAFYALNKGISKPESVDVDRYTAWQSGILWFEDKPMDEVLESISRRYNISFQVERNDLHNLLFTGKITDKDESDALKLIMMSSDITFETVGKRTLKVK